MGSAGLIAVLLHIALSQSYDFTANLQNRNDSSNRRFGGAQMTHKSPNFTNLPALPMMAC